MAAQSTLGAGLLRPGSAQEAVGEGRSLLGGPLRCRKSRQRVSRAVARVQADPARKESRRKEKLWQSELEPRQALARPAEGLNTVSVLSSADIDFDSSLAPAAERSTSWGVLNPLLDRWEHLPARWKVVTATSLAFVICNMVRPYGQLLLSASVPCTAAWSRLPQCMWISSPSVPAMASCPCRASWTDQGVQHNYALCRAAQAR